MPSLIIKNECYTAVFRSRSQKYLFNTVYLDSDLIEWCKDKIEGQTNIKRGFYGKSS